MKVAKAKKCAIGSFNTPNLKNGMLYHDIELEATKAMMEDASESIGIFSMSQT